MRIRSQIYFGLGSGLGEWGAGGASRKFCYQDASAWMDRAPSPLGSLDAGDRENRMCEFSWGCLEVTKKGEACVRGSEPGLVQARRAPNAGAEAARQLSEGAVLHSLPR